ncbi:hypothetical protein [Burkholderia cenocepacia]|uniref:hypothetical protein n=1 Tax=Burkholderia cenocepacia TaxID=95486 RepID=UPI001BA42C63|nr:hypothetical protein [Burkholderia cenocepacia]MBR8426168.1 hypothetical protein [Burkholderia cenocepacia]
MATSTEDEMRAYRRKNFGVRVEVPNDGMSLFEGEKVFRVTFNGRQDAAVLSLAPHEGRALYERLRDEFGFRD